MFFPPPHNIIYMLCAMYGFGPSEDFAAQTSDPSFCAIILGSRVQTSDPRICCANLGSTDLLRKPRIRTQSSRIAQPNLGHPRQQTHDRSRTQSSSAYASTKPRSIAHAKQFGHPRQRSYDRSRTKISSAIRGNEPTLPRMAELLCVRDRSWVCCRGWLRFGRAILDDCLRIRGLCSKIRRSEVCVRDPRIIAHNSDKRFAQQNPGMVRIRTLRITYIHYNNNYCLIHDACHFRLPGGRGAMASSD